MRSEAHIPKDNESISSDHQVSFRKRISRTNNDQRFLSLIALARRENKEDVLESFHIEYVLKMLDETRPGIVWKRLKTCYDSFQVLNELEQKMDRDHFAKLIKSNTCDISGTDKRERPILWFRQVQNLFDYRMETPRAFALKRYVIWTFQNVFRRAGSCTNGLVIFVDDSTHKILDFNMPLQLEILRLADALFPLSREEVWIFGHQDKLAQRLWKLCQQTLGSRHLDRWHVVAGKELVLDLVKDQKDIPSWWFGENDKLQTTNDPPGESDWERCMELGKKTITPREVYRAGPWERRTLLPSSDITFADPNVIAKMSGNERDSYTQMRTHKSLFPRWTAFPKRTSRMVPALPTIEERSEDSGSA